MANFSLAIPAAYWVAECLVKPESAFMMSAMAAEMYDISPPPVLDSGASCHLCPLTTEYMAKVVPGSMVRCVKDINTAGASNLQSTHSVTLLLRPEGTTEIIPLHDVLLVPGLRRMLGSISCLTDEGRDCLSINDAFHLLQMCKETFTLPREGKLCAFFTTAF